VRTETELAFFDQILDKPSDMKSHENLSTGVDLFRADRQTDRQTNMTKLIFPFRNFSKVPKRQTGNLATDISHAIHYQSLTSCKKQFLAQTFTKRFTLRNTEAVKANVAYHTNAELCAGRSRLCGRFVRQ
jgi:hypothetical protein